MSVTDKVVSSIKVEKILKPIQSTMDSTGGDKNEVLIDFRLGFTESQQKMFYFSLGDIFAELGGLSASVGTVIGLTASLMVLRYVFDLKGVIQRKSAHKFRLLTIDKYQKCLPQIKLIIATIPLDHSDYKEYMEDKDSIK